MLKVIYVDKEVQDAKDWLTENLSTEGVRWWCQDVPKIWYSEGNTRGGGIRVSLDVTDEEEALVTAFALRFS